MKSVNKQFRSLVLSLASQVLEETLLDDDETPISAGDLKDILEIEMPYFVTVANLTSLEEYERNYLVGYKIGLEKTWKKDFQNNLEQRVKDHGEALSEATFSFLPQNLANTMAFKEGLKIGQETGAWYNYCAYSEGKKA